MDFGTGVGYPNTFSTIKMFAGSPNTTECEKSRSCLRSSNRTLRHQFNPIPNKVVAGDGPHRAYLERKFPDTRFVGMVDAHGMAELMRQATVFVFPSRTDTFGLVMAEAMACRNRLLLIQCRDRLM